MHIYKYLCYKIRQCDATWQLRFFKSRVENETFFHFIQMKLTICFTATAAASKTTETAASGVKILLFPRLHLSPESRTEKRKYTSSGPEGSFAP